MIARRALQGHTQAETARLMGYSRAHVERMYPVALDRLAGILLRVEMLRPGIDRRPWQGIAEDEAAEQEIGPERRKPVGRVEACQEAAEGVFGVNA